MNLLARWWVWLRRINHCRGFGIQSPADYAFVRYVINEHWPYYQYDELGAGDDWLRRKLGRLYLRLANHVQPDVIADLAGYADYLHAGCHKAEIITHCSLQPSLIIARPDDVSPDLLSHCGEKTMLVVEDIGHHHQQWLAITQHAAATVTFDLYYCGIATFNPQRAKQHYTVNF